MQNLTQSQTANSDAEATRADRLDGSARSEKRSWRTLLTFTRKQDLPILIAAISCSVAASVASPAQAFIIGKVFYLLISIAAGSITNDDFLRQEREWILYLVGIACGIWLLHALEYTCWIVFGERQARSARLKLYDIMSRKDISWFDSSEDSKESALARYLTQIQEVQLAVSQPCGGIMSLFVTALLSIAQAFYSSWDLTLVTLAGAPIVAAVVILFGANMQQGLKNQSLALTEARGRCAAALSAIEIVKCFTAEHLEFERYRASIFQAAKYYSGVVNKNALQMAFLAFLIQAMFVQAFYYGGVLIHRGSRSASQVVTTFFSAIAAFQAVQAVIPQMLVLEKGRAAACSLSRFLDQDQRNTTQESGAKLHPLECLGDIRFVKASFSYPDSNEELVLDAVDLLIPGRQMTFIVGQSGSGKSTIGQLLVRFYSATNGCITLNGNDIRLLDTKWLRTQVFLVEQTGTLLNQSIGENIALGALHRADLTQVAIDAAAEFALLRYMLAELPNGLNTVMNTDASTISGGQLQRIALARARVRDPPILILDESTSALDQMHRTLIMDAIRTWRQDKTTIVITHDLAQVDAADYTYVLDHGVVVQHGLRKHIETREGSPFHRLLSSSMTPERRKESACLSRCNISDSEDPVTHALPPNLTRGASTFRMSTVWPTDHIWMNEELVSSAQGLAPYSSRSQTISSRLNIESKARQTADAEYQQSNMMYDHITKTGKAAAQKRQLEQQQERCSDYGQPALDQAEIVAGGNGESKTMLRILYILWLDSNMEMRALLLLGFWSATIHAVSPPVFAYVLSKLLGLYASSNDVSHQALVYSLVILGLAAIDAAHTYAYRFLLERVGQVWVDKLRSRAMHRLLQQPMAYFESGDTSVLETTQTLDQDAEEMRNLVGRFLAMVYIAIVMLVVSMVWALTVEWRMTLTALCAAPYILLVTSLYSKITEKLEGAKNGAVVSISSAFLETFTNIRTVRALTAEMRFHKRFEEVVSKAVKLGQHSALLTGVLYGMSSSAATFSIAMVFYVGSRLIYGGTSVMAILQVFTILIFAISNVSAILDFVPQLGTAKDTVSRMLALARLPKTSRELCGTVKLSVIGAVVLNKLQFVYPSRPGNLVLSDVSLTIMASSTVAIVGGSGSGKSTIAKLILRLHEAESSPRHQHIMPLCINGRAINQLSVQALRKLIAVVPQNSPVFSSSVTDNITYGMEKGHKLTASSQVIGAAKLAGIHDFITSLPQGYDTIIGHGGRGLSGGQMQRISIARALVRRPQFLILDEATSALDAESAKLIRQSISALRHEKDFPMTILIITHSRDMMELADKIVVLEHGMLVEEGAFPDLMSRRGHLAHLLNTGEIND